MCQIKEELLAGDNAILQRGRSMHAWRGTRPGCHVGTARSLTRWPPHSRSSTPGDSGCLLVAAARPWCGRGTRRQGRRGPPVESRRGEARTEEETLADEVETLSWRMGAWSHAVREG